MRKLIKDNQGNIPRIVLDRTDDGYYVLIDQFLGHAIPMGRTKPSSSELRPVVHQLLRLSRSNPVIKGGAVLSGMVGFDYSGRQTKCLTYRLPTDTQNISKENKMVSKKTPKMVHRFCVIGANSGAAFRNVARNWFETQEGAEQHAATLLKHRRDDSRDPEKLYVVAVVSVVELEKPQPPIEIRSPQQDDFDGYTVHS